MAKKWLMGDFATGLVTENDDLPVLRGSDRITLNINNEDFATLSVPKREIEQPENWKEYLKPVYKMVVACDTDKAWNEEGSILFAGFIKEVKMGLKEAIVVQVAGMREYASMRQPTSVYSGNVADPEAGVEFQGSDDQRLMSAIMGELWNSQGQGSNVPRPPTTQGGFSVIPNTGARKYKTKDSEFLYISDYLDDMRDTISLNANEYRFIPRWEDSSKTRIVWDAIVGADNNPQINLNTQTFNVNLNDNNFVTGASNTLTASDYATRLVGVSILGDEETPSDMRIVTSGEANAILVDAQFNPQVELTDAVLTEQMTSRINFMKNLQETGEVMVVRNADEKWITKVGGKVVMTSDASNPEVSGVNVITRLVETKFSLSNTEVSTTIMALKPKYGKLPNSPTRPNKFPGTSVGGGMPGYSPIMPKVPSNVPLPSGGGGMPVPEMPDFDTGNIYNDTKSFLTQENSQNFSANRWFQSGTNVYYSTANSPASVDATIPASVEQMNTIFSSMMPTTWSIDIKRFAFTNSSTALTFTSLFSLNVPVVLGWNNLFDNFQTFSSGGRNNVAMNYVIFTSSTHVYVWIYGHKTISYLAPGNRPIAQQGIIGSKVLRNSISGNDNTWEILDWDLRNAGGEKIYPTSQASITVVDNELLLAGAVGVTNTENSNITDISPNIRIYLSQNENDTIALSNNSFGGIYQHGIIGVDISNGGEKYYPAPAWQTDVESKYKNGSDTRVYTKPMAWMPANPLSTDGRLGIILLPVNGHSDGSKWFDPTYQTAFAYFNKNQATVEVGFTTVKTNTSTNQNFNVFNKNGLIGIYHNTLTDKYTRRTKNASGQFIESLNEPTLYGGWAGYRAIVGLNLESGFNQPILTYGNFWLASGLSTALRGTFSS